MILFAALGDVVQEGRNIERAALEVSVGNSACRERMIARRAARLDLRKIADRADQMLVHRVVVVHVELHHRDDAAEIRDEAAEHAGLVHAPQHRLPDRRCGEQIEEDAVGFRVVAQLVVDQRAARRAHGFSASGWIPAPVARRSRRSGCRLTGSRCEDVGSATLRRPFIDAEVRLLAHVRRRSRGPSGLSKRPRAGAVLQLLRFKAAQKMRGEIADFLGDEEVVLHEALDCVQAAMRLVAQALGHRRLEVEGQALLGAAGEEMQVAAHGPQEILALLEALQLRRGVNTPFSASRPGESGAIDELRDPEQRVQVAQAALAVLDVGLDAIAALARLACGAASRSASLASMKLGARCRCTTSLAEALLRVRRRAACRPDEAGFEHARCGWSCRTWPG